MVVLFRGVLQPTCQNSLHAFLTMELMVCPDWVNLFPTWVCHLIYYHRDKKYPCWVGIGSSQFLVLLASFRFKVLSCFCLLAFQWFCHLNIVNLVSIIDKFFDSVMQNLSLDRTDQKLSIKSPSPNFFQNTQTKYLYNFSQ